MTTGTQRIEVLVEREGERLAVRSPAVGLWIDAPDAGSPLGPGNTLGTLIRLNRRFRLVLPRDALGTVAPGVTSEHRLPVEYGQLLFHLDGLASPADRSDGTVGGEASAASADLPSGMYAVVAPTDGMFYRRPAPDAPPFVEAGSAIEQGQPVGLVEVMKTFNQIVYGGVGLPRRAEVVEIRCDDVEEVRAGQVLLVVRATV